MSRKRSKGKTGDYTFPTDKYLLIGKVKNAHGLKGEVNILMFSGQAENLHQYKNVTLVDRAGNLSLPLTIAGCRVRQNSAIVKFAAFADRNEAEQIEQCGVLVAQEDLPRLEEGEYFWRQYLGKDVFDQTGTKIGTISELFSNGAQDILVVTSHAEEYLIPLVNGIVIEENVSQVMVRLPEGLLDINKDTSSPQDSA